MLTNTLIRTLRPAERPYKVKDRDGLYLMVQPSGSLLWRYRFKILGKDRKMALGTHPEVSLKDARRKAR
ncbi:MAG: Arm DNA-binding domain-containing protein [Sphingomonas sp.]